MALHDLVENTIHGLRYRMVEPHLAPCNAMADLGCGDVYRFLRRYHAVAKQCWGLDITAHDIQDGNITIRRGDITKTLPFPDQSLDLVTCLAVLEHIENPLPILGECLRVLRPGGALILTTPSEIGIRVHEVLRRMRFVQDVEEGEHQDFAMSKERLAQWVTQSGFKVEIARSFEFGMNILVTARRP